MRSVVVTTPKQPSHITHIPMNATYELPETLTEYHQQDALDNDEWDDFRDAVREQYAFFITNPAETPAVGMSLWVKNDGHEYPVLENTGGLTLFGSRSATTGEAIPPTRDFVNLVGFGLHEALCFMRFDPSQLKKTADMVYDGKPRHHEVWAAMSIVRHLYTGDKHGERLPELRPLIIASNKYTEFTVPGVKRDTEIESQSDPAKQNVEPEP